MSVASCRSNRWWCDEGLCPPHHRTFPTCSCSLRLVETLVGFVVCRWMLAGGCLVFVGLRLFDLFSLLVVVEAMFARNIGGDGSITTWFRWIFGCVGLWCFMAVFMVVLILGLWCRGSWWFLVVVLVVVFGGAAHGDWCCF